MNKSRLDQMDLRFLQLRSPTALSIKNMAHSMEKRGQLAPVVLTGEENPYILIDGFKRYLAAESLGLESLKATFIHVDLTQAKIMMYEPEREPWIQEAMLVRELVDQDGLKQTEVAGLLDHHKTWVNRRLMIIRRLAPEILDDLRLELLPPDPLCLFPGLRYATRVTFPPPFRTMGSALRRSIDRHLVQNQRTG